MSEDTSLGKPRVNRRGIGKVKARWSDLKPQPAGREHSDQQKRRTQTDQISISTCGEAGRGSESDGPGCEDSDRLDEGNDDGRGLIRRQNGGLQIPEKAVGRTELHDVIGISGAGWLGEHGQRPSEGMVLMPGAIAFVMQHELHPICALLD